MSAGLKRNVVTTAPTTLAEGHEVYYYNSSTGEYTLYVGNSSDEPVAVGGGFGYQEYYATFSQSSTNAPTVTIKNSSAPNFITGFDAISWTRENTGQYKLAVTGSASDFMIFVTNGGSTSSITDLTCGVVQGEGGSNVGIYVIATDTDGTRADGVSNVHLRIVKFL